MKKLMKITMLICLLGLSITARANMPIHEVREKARFITDRMRYELHLSYQQYNDAYEVNFDFINNAVPLMPFVTRGDDWAINDYYRMLDIRNEDLRWILTSRQYAEFMGMDYFFRPIYASAGQWHFRIYLRYKDPHIFHFALPKHYHSYNGAHHRKHFKEASFYQTHFKKHYSHNVYEKHHSTRLDKNYRKISQRDFGHKPSKDAHPKPNKKQNTSRENKPNPSFHIGNTQGHQPQTGRPKQEEQKPQNNGNVSRPSRQTNNNAPGSTVSNRNNGQNNKTRVERNNGNSTRSNATTRSGNNSGKHERRPSRGNR